MSHTSDPNGVPPAAGGMAAPDAAFVICVEPGLLEYKALCLVLTFRKNAGRWKDLPILAYSPREGRRVAPWLKEIFAQLDVALVEEPINRDFVDYPLANKPLVMRDAERRLSQELVIFLDSDILVWDAPDDLELAPAKALGMVIDADKSVASHGPGDEFDRMWLDLYALAAVDKPHFVQTTLGRDRVRGWWCSGVIATRRSAGLMAQWLSVFERAMKADIFLPRAQYLREQMMFSAMATRHLEQVSDLSPRYNYHVQSVDKYLRLHQLAPESAILWHYQCYFDKAFVKFKKGLDRMEDAKARSDYAWKFIERLRTNHRQMVGINESRLASWRRRMRVGVRLRKLVGRSKDTDRFS
jgi:hypothetical protein